MFRDGLRSDQVSGLALVALAVFTAWANLAYPVGTMIDPGPGFMPLAIAVFLGATGMLVAATGGSSPRFAELRWPELARAAVVLGACGFGALALERLGYRLTMIALLVFFLGVVERKRPALVAAVALGFSLVSYLVFATWLKVPLPVGPGGI
ncbi:MAG: tripartite tricarboxylate transporter TctB family protein [Burkholderiales bacterium]|nr:tripartite tricarboxylate transporter TctB family protein [Burkholderiales bacterium]